MKAPALITGWLEGQLDLLLWLLGFGDKKLRSGFGHWEQDIPLAESYSPLAQLVTLLLLLETEGLTAGASCR